MAVLAGLLSGMGGAGLLVGLVFAGPFVAVAFVRVGGQHAVEWLPTVAAFAARKAVGQTEYRAKIDRPRPAGTLALPGDAAGAANVHRPGHRGVHGARPAPCTLSAVLSVSHPAYLLLGPDAQRGRVAAWGRVLAGLAQSGTCAGIQITESTIPDSGRGIAEFYARHGAHQRGVGGGAVRDAAGRQRGGGVHPSHDHHPVARHEGRRPSDEGGGGRCRRGGAGTRRGHGGAGVRVALRGAASRRRGWTRPGSRTSSARRSTRRWAASSSRPRRERTWVTPARWRSRSSGTGCTTIRAGPRCCGSASGPASRCPPSSCTP